MQEVVNTTHSNHGSYCVKQWSNKVTQDSWSKKAEDLNSTSYNFASISGEMLGDKDTNLFGDEGVSTATNSSQNGSVADEETTTVQSENTRSRSSKSSLKTVWRLSNK